jgi:MFS family permease
LLIDTAPIKASRSWRRLFFGSSISMFGSHMTFVAIPFQVFDITHSSLAVGLIGLCELVPLLTLSLLGGAIADAMDKRKLLIRTDLVSLAASGGLLVNALAPHPSLIAIYALTVVNAGLYAMSAPALRSATPRLLPRELFGSAAALDHVSHNIGAILGPALAGLFIGTVDLSVAYAIDGFTFVGSLLFLWRVEPIPPVPEAEPAGFKSILEGIRYLRGRPVLQGSFIVDLIAMIFGMPNALFPAIAATRFAGSAGALGLMYAAPSAGSLIASLLSGSARRVRRQGVAVYISVAIWGVAIAAFGAVSALALTLVTLAIAGGADSISGIYRSAILQTATPQHLQGRMHGVELAVVATGPSLGDIEAGVLASITNLRFAIVSGGLACIAGVAAMLVFLPEFARYDASEPTP